MLYSDTPCEANVLPSSILFNIFDSTPTLATFSATYGWEGILSATVTFTVTGLVDLNVGGALINSGNWALTSLTFTLGLDVSVQASIDIFVASAGIEGDLTLVSGTLPLTVGVKLSGPSFCEHVEIDLSMLSGSVSFFAKVDLIVYTIRKDWTILSWAGYTKFRDF